MMKEERRTARTPGDAAVEARARMRREMARLEAQGEKIGGAEGLAGAGAADEGQADAVEVWGRRIGRALGYLFALYLLWQLFSTYVMK